MNIQSTQKLHSPRHQGKSNPPTTHGCRCQAQPAAQDTSTLDSVETGTSQGGFSKAVDSIGKRFLLAAGVGAAAGLTYGIINNDYPALATIAGAGIGGTIGLPGAIGDHFAVEANLGLAERAAVVVAATAAGWGALYLLGR